MTQPTNTTLQWRAAIAAALLIALGAFLGVSIDRIWLVTFGARDQQSQVSVEALSTALRLDTREKQELAALVDSIGWSIAEAIEQNPDSLPQVARRARDRLEEAVPPDARPRFRNWMDGRRSEMLDRMRGRGMMRGRRGRGFRMRSDSLTPGRGRGRQLPY